MPKKGVVIPQGAGGDSDDTCIYKLQLFTKMDISGVIMRDVTDQIIVSVLH